MTYDHWKTTNPDDEFLGPDRDEEDNFEECDVCGAITEDLDWLGGYLVCPKCLANKEEDEAADRGDWQCHQERDQ